MSEETARLGRTFGPTDGRSLALGSELNLMNGPFDANLFRRPDHWVYIFTISNREFVVSQPPLFPRFIIPACPANKPYLMVGKIPHPFNQIDREGAVGDYIVRGHIGEQVAMSIINPNNYTLNQDAIAPEKSVLGLGNDLNAQGVFWSLNATPTAEELDAAVKRRERYYQGLLDNARRLETSNPKELEATLQQDYYLAAEYFGEERSWHKRFARAVECPLCGERMKPNMAVHLGQNGCGGVLDWDRAIASGLKKASERPKVSTEAGS